MTKLITTNWRSLFLLTLAAMVALLLASGSPAIAQAKKPDPKMAGAFPSLPGTAWKIDFGWGVTGTLFLFCKKSSGRWEIVPARRGTIGAVGKAYKVSGDTLTTVNADDGKTEKFKMAWKSNVLELNDGKTVLRLNYSGETQC